MYIRKVLLSGKVHDEICDITRLTIKCYWKKTSGIIEDIGGWEKCDAAVCENCTYCFLEAAHKLYMFGRNLYRYKGVYGLSSVHLAHCKCQDKVRKYVIVPWWGHVFVSLSWHMDWEHWLCSSRHLFMMQFRKQRSMETFNRSEASSYSRHLRHFTRCRSRLFSRTLECVVSESAGGGCSSLGNAEGGRRD